MKPRAKLTSLPSSLLATLVLGGSSNPIYQPSGNLVSSVGGGNASPLYDAKGLEVETSIRTIALAD